MRKGFISDLWSPPMRKWAKTSHKYGKPLLLFDPDGRTVKQQTTTGGRIVDNDTFPSSLRVIDNGSTITDVRVID